MCLSGKRKTFTIYLYYFNYYNKYFKNIFMVLTPKNLRKC